MPRTPRRPPAGGEDILTGRRRKAVPFEFVLDALAPLAPKTRPMFGCLAVYADDKLILILRDRDSDRRDNGVWLATAPQHHESLRRELPMLRSIGLLRKGSVAKKQTSWQVVPADAPQFEEAARRVCELVLQRDVRIGKVPDSAKDRRRSPLKPSLKPRADTSRTSTLRSGDPQKRAGRRVR